MKIAPDRTDPEHDGPLKDTTKIVKQKDENEAQIPLASRKQLDACVSTIVSEGGENGVAGNESIGEVDRVAIGEVDRVDITRSLSNTMREKLKTTGEVMCLYVKNVTKITSVPRTKPVCDVKLQDLTKGDTVTLAEGMLFFLRQEASQDCAMERFLESYPCMKELIESERYFQEMHIALVKTLLADQQKFAKVKLFVAGALSIGDLLTDIAMIVEYFRTGEPGYAWASLGSLLVNLTFQAIVSYTQNRARPWKIQVKEQLYVWSLVKPGVDAWRVASGSAHEEGHLMDAQVRVENK